MAQSGKLYDVVVVGGGASGTYAAVRLKDEGKEVLLIERDDHLGGHVNTYTDPATGTAIDFGVGAYFDPPGFNASAFFSRFNISTKPYAPRPGMAFRDFKTGQSVAYPPSNLTQADTAAALAKWTELAKQYSDWYFPGYAKLADGAPLPDDLLMTFRDFIAKYDLAAALPVVRLQVEATGDVLDAPMLFVFAHYGIAKIGATGAGYAANNNNSELYAAAEAYLAPDTLLASTVRHVKRDEKGVELTVENRVIRAKKLLITFVPLERAMAPFDLDAQERAVFSRLQWHACQATVVRADLNSSLVNTASSEYGIPSGDFALFCLQTAASGLFTSATIGGPELTVEKAKELIRAGTNGSIVAFADHSPLEPRPSPEDLKAGFYKDLFALQGHRSTYYTGAAWAADYSSVIWMFTEQYVLPKLLGP